jgi:hypothetical protein
MPYQKNNLDGFVKRVTRDGATMESLAQELMETKEMVKMEHSYVSAQCHLWIRMAEETTQQLAAQDNIINNLIVLINHLYEKGTGSPPPITIEGISPTPPMDAIAEMNRELEGLRLRPLSSTDLSFEDLEAGLDNYAEFLNNNPSFLETDLVQELVEIEKIVFNNE